MQTGSKATGLLRAWYCAGDDDDGGGGGGGGGVLLMICCRWVLRMGTGRKSRVRT